MTKVKTKKDEEVNVKVKKPVNKNMADNSETEVKKVTRVDLQGGRRK